MQVMLGIWHFDAMVQEPLPDPLEENTLHRADAILRVVNLHPQIKVDGIIAEAR